MSFKQLNVKEDTFVTAKDLSGKYEVPMYLFIGNIVSFFEENETMFNADFFKKSKRSENNIIEKFSLNFKKIIREEVNRLIGFLKVQDKFMKTMKKDIIYSISDGDIENYHPLFIEYNFIIDTYKDILMSKGFLKDSDVYEFILKNQGKVAFDNFIESEQKIKEKKLFIDF